MATPFSRTADDNQQPNAELIDVQRQSLEILKAHYNTIKKNITWLEAHRDKLETKITAAEEKLETCENEITAAEVRLKELKKSGRELTVDLNDLKGIRNMLVAEANAAKEEKQRYEGLETDNKDIEVKNAWLQKEFEDLSAKIKELEIKHESLANTEQLLKPWEKDVERFYIRLKKYYSCMDTNSNPVLLSRSNAWEPSDLNINATGVDEGSGLGGDNTKFAPGGRLFAVYYNEPADFGYVYIVKNANVTFTQFRRACGEVLFDVDPDSQISDQNRRLSVTGLRPAVVVKKKDNHNEYYEVKEKGNVKFY